MHDSPPCTLCDKPTRPWATAQGLAIFKCDACGTLRQGTDLTAQEIAQIYNDGYYESWNLAAAFSSVEAMKRQTFANILDRLGTWARPGRLLDVGCAAGFLMAEAQARGWEAFGTEINPYAVALARKRFGENVHQGALETLKFAPESFEAITLIDCIEHIADPNEILSRAHELLVPGGVLIILTPDAGSLSARVLGRWWPPFKREHLFYPTRKGLAQAAQRKGFEILEIESAWKSLTPDYFIAQFAIYPKPLITPLLRAVGARLPPALKNRAIWLRTGEMLGYFKKQ